MLVPSLDTNIEVIVFAFLPAWSPNGCHGVGVAAEVRAVDRSRGVRGGGEGAMAWAGACACCCSRRDGRDRASMFRVFVVPKAASASALRTSPLHDPPKPKHVANYSSEPQLLEVEALDEFSQALGT